MEQSIRVVSPFPDDAVVSGVHEIANALYRKRGYLVSVSLADTKVVLEATHLMVRYAQQGVLDAQMKEG